MVQLRVERKLIIIWNEVRKNRRTKLYYSRKRGFATIGEEASEGSPGPALFTAITLNSYSWPSTRSGTRALVLAPSISKAFSHWPKRGFFSTMYPVIGDPPSFLGGVHSKSTRSLSQSVATGVPGLSGLSYGSLAVIVSMPVSGKDSPCLFTARTRN